MEDVYNEVHSENLNLSDEIKAFKNEIADLNDECQSYKQVNMDLTRENQKLFASLQTEGRIIRQAERYRAKETR